MPAGNSNKKIHRGRFTPAKKLAAVLQVLTDPSTMKAVAEGMGATVGAVEQWIDQARDGLDTVFEKDGMPSQAAMKKRIDDLEARLAIRRAHTARKFPGGLQEDLEDEGLLGEILANAKRKAPRQERNMTLGLVITELAEVGVAPLPMPAAKRRGPKPTVTDNELFTAIEAIQREAPGRRLGYRLTHQLLRGRGIRVDKDRVRAALSKTEMGSQM